jgi:serpin B
MKKALLILLTIIIVLTLAACSQTASASELKSDKPRETPAVNQSDLQKLVEGNTAFAANLYKLLKEKDGNFFYSPHSISEALAMTFGGARTTTEKQMAETLNFLLSSNQLHTAFNSLDAALASRGQGAKGKDDQGFRLHVVNAIWGQKDFSFLPAYLDLLAQNYGAGLRILDFKKSPEPSRQTINQWVSDQTEGKIKDLLPKGSIDDYTRMVLTNAIYFNAAWLSQFQKNSTFNGTFTLIDGSKVTVPMMNQQKFFNYNKGANYQVVELYYDGRELSMVIILPDASQFTSFENALSGQQLSQIIGNLSPADVRLSMPKFKIESEFSLKDALSDLGMPVAFTDQADFSGMDGKRDLFIKDVVHKSFVDVDEAGTEAAAATGVIVGLTSMPTEIKEMKIDHPFIFLIRDIQTGAILFIGRVMNPAG